MIKRKTEKTNANVGMKQVIIPSKRGEFTGTKRKIFTPSPSRI